MVQQDMRKGTWTEQEDIKLVSFVGLFGDRRWDFIAKVSGLHRTGKSCRLRWVNYLHPGLKRGKMTPQEERLVLELHSKWGNRWSKIARKLPGRTDNEIKNYWRTHMRKMAQEKKRAAAASSSSSASSNNSSFGDQEESFYDKGGPNNMMICSSREIKITGEDQECEEEEGYSMDDIWKDIEVSEENNSEEYNFSCPSWEYSSSESLWVMDEGESQIFNPFFPQGAPLL